MPLSHLSKKELETLLTEEVKGKECLPALVHHSIEEFEFLQKYKVLPMEVLYTIAGHIKNIYQEIQYHLDKQEKEKFSALIHASFSGEEAKRGCDYRLSLVDVSKMMLEKNILRRFHSLFLTLVEIQGILYSSEIKRTSKQILRLYNLTFIHAMEIKKNMEYNYL